MSNFPINFDDDATLPAVNDNIQDLGAEAINAVRDAVFNIEQNIGLTAAGTTGSISNRLDVLLLPDGMPKSSILTSLGLITLPITNDQIIDSAEIPESKLRLDHRTQDLFNYIQDLAGDINISLGWISITGIKLEPHLLGAIYRHTLSQIDVSLVPSQFLNNKFHTLRNNSESYSLINDINNELLTHQFSDGTVTPNIQSIITFGGSTYPSNYAHTASGIFLNTSRFTIIPQTAKDLQQLAEFIDSSSIFTFGGRIQNLYSNGISRSSRSFSLLEDGYSINVIPVTHVITYLLNNGTSSIPIDDINTGDDIIEFIPPTNQVTSNSFDEKFALVKIGDVIRVNYGTVEVSFLIKEKKYIQNFGNKKYIVRIAGKNLFYSINATARIDKPFFNNNKYGVLTVAPANNNFFDTSSLIVGQPHGAQCLGIGFNPNQFDNSHYLLYLVLYPTGDPTDGYVILPGVDVTGNQGGTPGQYDLFKIVENTNNIFRQPGFNYRFIAFAYAGEFGIMLADPYNNVSFSIISGLINTVGFYDKTATTLRFPNNVIDVFTATNGSLPIDALGLGPQHANLASPPFLTTYGSAEASQTPTRIFSPLRKNNYYVDGIEKERLSLESSQNLDRNGDGYWVGTITNSQVFPGPSGRVEVTYNIPIDLSQTSLKIGKTLVVQPLSIKNNATAITNFGRFIIKGINISCAPNSFTEITVYDAVHGTGISPVVLPNQDIQVVIYFNADSISFNKENSTDVNNLNIFKRFFEIYTDSLGTTFTHERGRINISGSNQIINGITLHTSSDLGKLNLVKISPKLRGYQFGNVNKITLNILNYDNVTETFSGRLNSFDGINHDRNGSTVFGKKGEIVRFYDESNIDYVDIIFEFSELISSFVNANLDIQLFPTLELDEEIMLLATCQFNDISKVVNYLRDERQFGNISEKDLSSSLLNFISHPERLLHSNGIIRGFDILDGYNLVNNQIYLSGGEVLVNGKFIQKNSDTVSLPIVKELFNSVLFDIEWAVCINEQGEYQTIPLLDSDITINNPTDPTRKFTAFNPANASSYLLDASTFSDLVGKRKDLTILYIVLTVVNHLVTPATITLFSADARKYINDGESNDPIILTTDDMQGNFKSFRAVSTWLNKNTSHNTHVLIRGEIDIFSPPSLDVSIPKRQITFEGDGGIINVHSNIGFFINSFVKFKNIHFIYKNVPSPALTNADTVNNGQGLLYITTDLDFTLNDVAIEDCVFTVDNVNGQKYPYINLDIRDNRSVINNLNIKNNHFKVKNINDRNAAIAIVNNETDNNILGACLIKNLIIDNNILDGEQSIIITTAKNVGTNLFQNPGIACFNSRISNNFCDAIGALVTTVSGADGYSEFGNGLLINNNTCKYIANLDEKGKFIEVYNIGTDTLNVINNTGSVVIKDNNCSFIHYGFNRSNDSYLKIINNNLYSNFVEAAAHGTDYLSRFNYPFLNKRYAIYVSSPLVNSTSDMNVIISDNITGPLQTIIDPGTGNDNTRYEAYLRCGASAIITNNIFEGIADAININDFEYSGIIFDGYSGIISENYLSRTTSTGIYAYMTTRFNLTSSIRNFVKAIGNIFDNFNVNNASQVSGKDASGNNITDYWDFEKNTNQVDIMAINGMIGIHAGKVATDDNIIITDSPSAGWDIALNDTPDLDDNHPNIKMTYTDAALTKHHKWMINLKDILPNNVLITKLQLDVKSTVIATGSLSGTTLSLYYNNSLINSTTASYVSPYVADTNITLSLIPNTRIANTSGNQINCIINTTFGHNSNTNAIVKIKKLFVTYQYL